MKDSEGSGEAKTGREGRRKTDPEENFHSLRIPSLVCSPTNCSIRVRGHSAPSKGTPETHREIYLLLVSAKNIFPSLLCRFSVWLLYLGLLSFMRLGGSGWISIVDLLYRPGLLSLYSQSLKAYTSVRVMCCGLKNGNRFLRIGEEESHLFFPVIMTFPLVYPELSKSFAWMLESATVLSTCVAAYSIIYLLQHMWRERSMTKCWAKINRDIWK